MENLIEWSFKMQGAREMLQKIRDEQKNGAKIDLDPAKCGAGKIYTEAIFNLVLESLDNVGKYLQGRKIDYRNCKHDKKGKFISCEAYFI